MIQVSEKNAVRVIKIEAKIVDAKVAGAIRETVMEIVPQSRRFAIDFSGTNLVDSGGLAGIVMIHKFLASQQCHMALSGLNKSVLGLFKLTRMDRLFELHDGLESSVKYLEEKS